MKVFKLPHSFHRWLFAEGDPTTLSVLRIVFGTIAFTSLWVQHSLLNEFYSERGLLSQASLALWQWRGPGFNPLLFMSFEQIELFYGVALLVTALFTFGLCTRLTSWLTFLSLLAFNLRNPLLLNSGDVLLRVVICYLALSRCEARVSLDAILRQMRSQPLIATAHLFPQRLIQLQIALVYLVAVLHKIEGSVWLDGTALWYVSRIEELSRFPLPSFMMGEVFTKIGTWGTLLIQTSIFSLVWFRKFRFVLLGGVLLHGAIDYQMNIPFFSIITVSCYLSFVEGSEWKRILKTIKIKRSQDEFIDAVTS